MLASLAIPSRLYASSRHSQDAVCGSATYAIEGSIVYGVYVPTARQSEAIRLIKGDLRKRTYNITLRADGKDLEFSVPDAAWRTSEPRLRHADLLAGDGGAASTDLGVILRTPTVTNEALAFPYVVRVRSLEREYRDSEGKTQVGHEFHLEFAVKPDEEIGGKRLFFEVWDHGKQVASHGSNCGGMERRARSSRTCSRTIRGTRRKAAKISKRFQSWHDASPQLTDRALCDEGG